MVKYGILGSREFKNWGQLERVLDDTCTTEDELVSGGAVGVDSMAQRYAKERGLDIHIFYPKYSVYGKSAPFVRNKLIAENSDLVLAFYQLGRFQQGGTAHTAKCAIELGIPLLEFEEE